MDSFHNVKCEDKDKGKGCRAYSHRDNYTLQKRKTKQENILAIVK